MRITNRAVFRQVCPLAEEDLWGKMFEVYVVPRASEMVKPDIDKIGDRATCRFCVQATPFNFCKRGSRDMAGPVMADTLSSWLRLKVSAENLFPTNVVPRASEKVQNIIKYFKFRMTRGRDRKLDILIIGDKETFKLCVKVTLVGKCMNKFCKLGSRDMARPVVADTLRSWLGIKASAEKMFQTYVCLSGHQSFLATDCCKAALPEKGIRLLEGSKVTTNEDRVVIKSEKDAIDDDRRVTPALETGDVKHAPDTVNKFHIKHEVKEEEVLKFECGAEIMQMEGDAWYEIVEPTKKEEGVCDESKPFVPTHHYLGDNHDDAPRRIIVAGLASDEHFPGSCRVFLP